ncbi:MAG: polyprenyl synthetase family protein [Candidatus Omnitrophota bacterium]
MKIRNKIEAELKDFLGSLEKTYRLKSISPLLFKSINEFVKRDGKRIRPILFVIGYLGYSKKKASLLYRSASSLELLHDFMLVHDDIIDKSDTRRGKPSMHAVFNRYLKDRRDIKFNGQDLAIIAGDVMYAMALHAFLSIKEKPENKEAAFRKLIEAALYTGTGEFIELILNFKKIGGITKNDIYKVYDLKTANYTFSTPLVMGATLAGASKNEITRLHNYGIYLGRAFQIRDDILGTFGEKEKTGKSNTTDLQEAKKTLLIWYAYNKSGFNDKASIKKILSGKRIRNKDILKMRAIIKNSGALAYANNEITELLEKAAKLNRSLSMKENYRLSLDAFSKKMLGL